MYLRFNVRHQYELEDIQREIHTWAVKYHVRYSQKTIKHHHRVGFDHDEHFTLFAMTFNPNHRKIRPWLDYQIINIVNERY